MRFQAVPVEALRAFLEPLGYRFDWGPELEGIGFHWLKPPLSDTGVRATYFPDGGEGLLVLETDGRASVADAAMQDVTARLMAERFADASSGARPPAARSTRAGRARSRRRPAAIRPPGTRRPRGHMTNPIG